MPFEEMGNIFKKISKGIKKVADVHKKVIKKSINVQKNLVKKVAEGRKKVIKAVAKKGVHFINRFTNPGTILYVRLVDTTTVAVYANEYLKSAASLLAMLTGYSARSTFTGSYLWLR